jgi:hypothetical protein
MIDSLGEETEMPADQAETEILQAFCFLTVSHNDIYQVLIWGLSFGFTFQSQSPGENRDRNRNRDRGRERDRDR